MHPILLRVMVAAAGEGKEVAEKYKKKLAELYLNVFNIVKCIYSICKIYLKYVCISYLIGCVLHTFIQLVCITHQKMVCTV